MQGESGANPTRLHCHRHQRSCCFFLYPERPSQGQVKPLSARTFGMGKMPRVRSTRSIARSSAIGRHNLPFPKIADSSATFSTSRLETRYLHHDEPADARQKYPLNALFCTPNQRRNFKQQLVPLLEFTRAKFVQGFK